MHYVYVLLSLKDHQFYVGSTTRLSQRFTEHQRGQVISTRNRLPVKLICYEAYLYNKEALARERFLKSSDGKKDLRRRLKLSLGE